MAIDLYNQAISACKKQLYHVENGKHSSLYKTDPDFFNKVSAFIVDSTNLPQTASVVNDSIEEEEPHAEVATRTDGLLCN